ncbi:MAG: hypothetical protein ACFFC7_04215 [Candidatus Hermodarchaeota archaeon]
MMVDELKKDFIVFMENLHEHYVFPKNYFGTLMAVFIEQQPVTQERIEYLTGYSRTTISQMLKLIRINFPLIQVKKPGKRKKFYEFNIDPTEFMINLFQRLLEFYKDRVDFLPPLIEEINPYAQKNARFLNFRNFMENFYRLSNLFFRLTSETAEEFTEIMRTGRIDASELPTLNLLRSPETVEFIQNLLTPPETPSNFEEPGSELEDSLVKLYTKFKHKYYQEVKRNLILVGSPNLLNFNIIATELLIEQRPITQEEIEASTNFHRSIISDTLKRLQSVGLVEVIKKPGHRKKHYQAIHSWDSLMFNKFTRNINYAEKAKNKIKTLIEQLETIKSNSNEYQSLLTFFKKIYNSFDLYEHYFHLLEAKYIKIRLQESKHN